MTTSQGTSFKNISIISNTFTAKLLPVMVGDSFSDLRSRTNNKIAKGKHDGVFDIVLKLNKLESRFSKSI